MTINFSLKFYTKFGQALFVSGNNEFLGNNEISKAVELSYIDSETWGISLELAEGDDNIILYKYLLRDLDGTVIFDGEENRALDLTAVKAKSVSVIDAWNADSNVGNVFFTRPFSEVLLPPLPKNKSSFPKKYTHEFRVKAPLLKPGEVICMTGSSKNLKYWDVESPVLLTPKNHWFVARMSLQADGMPLSYKYGIYNVDDKKFVRFEDGENRMIPKDAPARFDLTIVHDGFARCPVTYWKGAGVAIPVFSLRTEKSFGVGEFNDMLLLVDWAKKTGLKVIQILPVNDTTAHHTWKDSYPYAAISAFAIHPLYINLEKVAGKEFSHIVKPLKKKKKQLNDLARFDYEQVMKFKLSALRELFTASKDVFKNDPAYFIGEGSFGEFFELNREWLVPYAVFSYLRDKYKTPDFTKWKSHKKFSESSVQKYASPKHKHYDEIAFYYFVQYHLHLQLKEVADYAHSKEVILKGDIPIGIYRYGSDAWANPSLYNMNEQAGAPPDGFAVKGQNWGFPTYNWVKMKEDGFKWWSHRFDQMSNYFDAFRIDHILGFFRIWSIPIDTVEGILGRFVPAIPVDISEFYANNIWFDYDRYCKPYITEEIIWNVFADTTPVVKDRFLDALDYGRYQLKKEFSKQKQVADFLRKNKMENRDTIQHGLFDLISNVILLEEPGSGGQKFNFRFGIEQTSSFQNLDEYTRNKLHDLYVNYFYRRQDNFWKQEALKKLPQLKHSTNMLVCGEDLGMVPGCVPEVMRDLGILSLEIQRMPKDPTHDFFHPKDAPYLSVVTPSTHDMSTVRAWWEEDRGKTQQFYNYILGHYGQAPYFCDARINKEIILQHVYSPAMWSIFQLQDLLGMNEKIRLENPHDERINVPSEAHHYWHYRMHISLEDLLKEDEFNGEVRKMMEESGRTPNP
ncbi:MAG: 4-alpha-glucanotransferase [Ginsengibacter sp.]